MNAVAEFNKKQLNMKRFFLLLIVLYTFSGCKKEGDDIYIFEGILNRSDVGEPMGGDLTDWLINDSTWSDQEAALFSTSNSTNCTPTFPYYIEGFPNPCTYKHTIMFLADSASNFEYRLVNNRLMSLEVPFTASKGKVEFDTRGVSPGMYRLYYKFTKNGCEFRGHGDIQVKK